MVVALIAVPAGFGAKPDKTHMTATQPVLVPAGLGCAFDFRVAPNGHAKVKEYSDGRVVTQAQATVTMTNLEGPGSYIQLSDFKATDTFVDANTVNLHHHRRSGCSYPDDQGPFGVVGANGAARVRRPVVVTLDLNTFAFTSFSYKGPVVDLCAELAD